ncbi:hypothetical protein O3301_11240, partial [Janthinobacterium sp. SUN211]|uniref:hypothetical protein n=1 Tax=Janthinobacterium sp. SUN211 TaxID=3014786 RepID=UPI0027130070
SLLMGRSLKKLTGHYFRSAYFIISCEHLIYFKYYSNPKIAAALTSNAHTYRLLIVKELYSVTAFALSTKRCVCQLRRRKSMKHFCTIVNTFFSTTQPLKAVPFVPQTSASHWGGEL